MVYACTVPTARLISVNWCENRERKNLFVTIPSQEKLDMCTQIHIYSAITVND